MDSAEHVPLDLELPCVNIPKLLVQVRKASGLGGLAPGDGMTSDGPGMVGPEFGGWEARDIF